MVASVYSNILVATDLHSDALPVVNHALEIAKKCEETKLTIVNVIPNVPYYMASGLSLVSEIEDQLIDQTKQRFRGLKGRMDYTNTEFVICHGSAKMEIVKLAKDIDTDLIVIGSHGRHGVQRLLGSTANGVLQRATCDVLVVRLDKDRKKIKQRAQRIKLLSQNAKSAQDQGMPEPSEVTSEPGEKTPEPGAMPEPSEVTSEPGEQTPEPGAMPEPSEVTSEPGEQTPEPGEQTPESGEQTPESGEQTPEPGEKTPGLGEKT